MIALQLARSSFTSMEFFLKLPVEGMLDWLELMKEGKEDGE